MLPEIGLVDLAERLAGTVDAQLEIFASRMREALLAASVEIGLGAMSELVEAEVTEIVGLKAVTTRTRRRTGMAVRTAR